MVASCPRCGCQLAERPHQDRVERKTARRRCPVQVEVAWTPALPLALVVPAGPSPDGAGLPCSQSGATGYTNSRPSGRRQPGGDTNAAATDQQPPRRRQQPPHRDPERPPDQGWRRRLDRAPVLAVLTVLAVLEYNRVERGAGDTSPDPTAGPLWHHPEQEPPGRGGRRMPPLEPLWVAFVTVVLAGCVVLGVRAVRRRRGRR